MRIPCVPATCSRVGRNYGIILAALYSGVLTLVWLSPQLPYERLDRLLFDFTVFWLYGIVIGGIIGAIGGAVTGYIICYLLIRLRVIAQLPAWLVGFVTCTFIWCVISLTVGLFFLLGDPSVRDSFLILFLYPGIIYIVAGTLLSGFVDRDGTNTPKNDLYS